MGFFSLIKKTQTLIFGRAGSLLLHAGLSLVTASRDCSLVVACRLLTAVASVVERGL